MLESPLNLGAVNTSLKINSNGNNLLNNFLNTQNFSVGAFYNQMSINELLESGKILNSYSQINEYQQSSLLYFRKKNQANFYCVLYV